jgi:hypothetical protein
MVARPVPALPDEQRSEALAFEPKLDGWRCLAFHRSDGRVDLQSRQHKQLTAYFPEIVAAVRAQIPPEPSPMASSWCTTVGGATSWRYSSASSPATPRPPKRRLWYSTC